ncbi:MAG TPA: glycosyltransferase family 9 protein, partial [Thermomicrobiaceae bacterium]|nr:glycosyltransferase family 9 protein [Thermomicrobiaceae bacterium]
MIRPLARALLTSGLAARAPDRGAPSSRSVLLIRPDHLGDLLFLTPGLRRFRAALPGWRIALVVGPWGAPVLAGNPDIDELIELPFPGFTRAPKPHPLQPYQLARDAAARLRARGCAAAVVLRDDHWWGGLLARLAGIPLRVGADDPALASLLTLQVPVAGHSVARNAALLDAAARLLGGSPPDTPPTPERDPLSWRVTPEDRAAAQRLTGLEPYVAIHPGSGAPVKSWPAARWAELADRLAAREVRVVFTGGEAERWLVETIRVRMTSGALNLAGQSSLRTLGALYSDACAVVGVDSGPLHLAVAAGAPTLQLYGPSDPAKFGPWGPAARHRVL